MAKETTGNSTSSGPDDDSDNESDSAELSLDADDALRWLERWYHVPILTVVMLYMFWSRFQNYSVFQQDGEGVLLLAVDSWYHWRTTEWTVENYPGLIGFEPWTAFPDGTLPGQFGTFYDFIVASLAMIIGFGSPGEQDILLAVLISVPAMAALVAIPVYYMAKRLGNRPGALVGVGVLSLFSGTFFVRSTAGMHQHHVAEVLFMSLAVLATMVALRVGEVEKPIWELVRERNWSTIRAPTIYSAIAGLAITLYIWTWPPGIVLIGILGLFFIIQLPLDYVRGRSPDHLAFVGIVIALVVAAGTALRIQEPGFSATGLDYFPPVFALLLAAGCLFLAALARVWDSRQLSRTQYPTAVAVSVVGGLVAVAIVLPGVFDTLLGNLWGRIIPWGHSPGALTVAEVQPPDDVSSHLWDEYRMAAFLAPLAILLFIASPLFGREYRAEYTLVIVWTAVLFSMALTQMRFNYYFVVPLAVLSGALVGFIIDVIEIPESENILADIQPFQILTLAVVVMVLFMPLLPPFASATPMDRGGDTFPEGEFQHWQDAPKWELGTEWLAENTPEVGNYAGAGNEDEIEYFGYYGWPEDGTFDYSEGMYGVLSWWDYGHWITAQGERIPHSNPFQQNVPSSAAFLTAQEEEQAELYLDAIAAGMSVDHESDMNAVQEAAQDGADEPGIQYVMIDDDSAAGKFHAITQWTGPDYMEYVDQVQLDQGMGQGLFPTNYYDTMLAQLYFDDATGLEHYRLVHEVPTYTTVGFDAGGSQAAVPYPDRGEWTEEHELVAEQLEDARGEGQIMNVPTLTELTAEGVVSMYESHLVSALKTFERVEGTTLEGQVDQTGGWVSATLTLETETERQFTYEQTAEIESDGTFELTVPYPTDETLGPDDGYADSSVVMSDDDDGYDLTVYDGDDTVTATADGIDVPEPSIQQGETIPVSLEPVADDTTGETETTESTGE